ncbi:MAG: hypothetical protein WDN04_00410 [Rhodospirillales bacterium]
MAAVLRGDGVRGIGGGVEHAAGDGAVQQAGVEVGQAERGGQAAGQGCPCRRRRGRQSR